LGTKLGAATRLDEHAPKKWWNTIVVKIGAVGKLIGQLRRRDGVACISRKVAMQPMRTTVRVA